MIVKIQVPLFGPAPWLIYNKEKSVNTFMEPDEQFGKVIGSAKKAFFRVTLDSKGLLIIHEKVEDQNW
jgi:hypothetical protein